jgi:membrane associated rhomboid family serine protease
MTRSPSPAPAPAVPYLAPALIALLVACSLPELVLQGADLGLWGSPRWRPVAYGYGAFWAGLLHGWRPNYPFQPAAMFATYGFLHGGILHLVFNVITLASIGAAVIARAGQARFLALFAAALLGGGLGFGLLARVPAPMVGASGALFGLVGALIAWNTRDALRRARGARARLGAALRLFAWPALVLGVLNALVFHVTGGALAWETHLGGFAVGVLLAPLLQRD